MSDRRPLPDGRGGHRAAASEPAPGPDLGRLARLVADGVAPFPADLAPADAEALGAAVVRLRRDRLVRHVARAIARDIRRERGP